MNMINYTPIKLSFLFFATLILFSCKKDDTDPIVPEPTPPTYHSFQGNIGAHDNSTLATYDNNLLICGNNLGNICVLKISKAGTLIWRKEFKAGSGSYGSGLAQSSNQDIFICGNSDRNGPNAKYDVLLIKLNSNGDTLWTKTYGGSEDDYGYYLTNTRDGNLLICGISSSYTSDGYSDIYLIKINTDGDTIWTKTYPEEAEEYPFHVLETQNGEFLVTGSNEDFGTDEQLFFFKVNAEGTPDWNKKIGLASKNWGLSTIELSNGDLVTCGKITKDNLDQILVTKTDGLGNVLWEKEYGETFLSEQGNSIQSNADGSFIITGSSYETHSGTYQIVLLKINSNGDQLFLKEFGDSFINSGKNVLKDENDDNIITGNNNGIIFMTRTDNNGVFK
jgi:hypothetical protein